MDDLEQQAGGLFDRIGDAAAELLDSPRDPASETDGGAAESFEETARHTMGYGMQDGADEIGIAGSFEGAARHLMGQGMEGGADETGIAGSFEGAARHLMGQGMEGGLEEGSTDS